MSKLAVTLLGVWLSDLTFRTRQGKHLAYLAFNEYGSKLVSGRMFKDRRRLCCTVNVNMTASKLRANMTVVSFLSAFLSHSRLTGANVFSLLNQTQLNAGHRDHFTPLIV